MLTGAPHPRSPAFSCEKPLYRQQLRAGSLLCFSPTRFDVHPPWIGDAQSIAGYRNRNLPSRETHDHALKLQFHGVNVPIFRRPLHCHGDSGRRLNRAIGFEPEAGAGEIYDSPIAPNAFRSLERQPEREAVANCGTAVTATSLW